MMMGEASAAEVGPGLAASSTLMSAGIEPLPPMPPAPPPMELPEINASAGTLVGNPSAAPADKPPQSGDLSGAAAFDAKFKGTPLEGKWDAIKASAEKNGIKPSLAAAVMAHETGYGKNVKGNNPAGLMDPKQNWMKKQQFESIDKGIDAAVVTIAKNFNRAGGSEERLWRIEQALAPWRQGEDEPLRLSLILT
jgi:hypothetical protein